MKYKIAWDVRDVLKPGKTTDREGFAPLRFGYSDGSVETIDVRGPERGMSHGTRKIGQDGYANVWVYETRNGDLRIIAEADVVHNT